MVSKELIFLRKKFLKDFDKFIRENIEDEAIVCDVWLAGGLPDGWDNQDLTEIARDEELWLDVVNCFNRCCKMAGMI